MKDKKRDQPTGCQFIDVPFEFRHTCWFCGEPYYESYSFMAIPNYEQQKLPIMVPCCQECFSFCKSIKASGLDLLRDKVKEKLHRKYEKHLQIGANWTKEELEDCEFEGKALEGFRESAWKMFEIAKERVNYTGWPLTIDGLPMVGISSSFHIEFNGITYTGLSQAVEQLAKAYNIPQAYLEDVVEVVGRDRLSYAIRFAKTTYGYSSAEREASIGSLKALLAEERALSQPEITQVKGVDAELSDIQELILYRTMISPIAIRWCLKQGIVTLAQLAEQEEAFFEYFMKDSELVAFTYFNGMQVYLEKREQDTLWAENEDPNRGLFAKLASE
ncbi:hypothetical protein MD588_03855 [Photobacterium sp. SDRW27]|uniref:hypothetical protein n=1 Tax=Photobacterium obscurum TaxID=2829490 RepID=UPI0022432EF3|nr:hypothetical protein [Photobacterium obscurum]MCW8327933.1 hypothetical protein [Photobacterium obscurum]